MKRDPKSEPRRPLYEDRGLALLSVLVLLLLVARLVWRETAVLFVLIVTVIPALSVLPLAAVRAARG